MAPPPLSAPLSLLLLLLLLSSPAAAGISAEESPTAYEMLEKHGFPRGILPLGVSSYLLRPDNSFRLFLGFKNDCDFAVDGGYLLKYKNEVSGRLDEADGASPALRDLRGVSVKVFFIWFSITEVVRVGRSSLAFRVGPLSASFPLSNFEECPRCRCGFDCSIDSLSSDS
ncbi:uncharacterized protein LOC144710832 [Wolffia australiana]